EVARWLKIGEPFETNNGVAPFGNGGPIDLGEIQYDAKTNCIYVPDGHGGLYVLSDTKGKACNKNDKD
ncbi:MAG: hypothetical protein AB7V32_07130, partial [Candidatus Berkiella sp.]